MWADFMQFLPGAGVPRREVADLVPLTNLAGLERWGYVTVGPDPADRRLRRPADPAGVLPRYPMVTHRGGYPDGS